MKNRPKLISEISCNHNNSLDLTKELIDKNIEAGTDFIKLQLYSPQTITGNFNHKIKGTIWKNLDLYKLYKKTHMKKKMFDQIVNFCIKKNYPIFTSIFDETGLLEVKKKKFPIIKISSFEIVDLNLIKAAAKQKKEIILSTGMANLNEIDLAIQTIRKYTEKFTLLHCISSYPTKIKDLNLSTIDFFKKIFKCNVGLSDHSMLFDGKSNPLVPYDLCKKYGAKYIEVHTTLSRKKDKELMKKNIGGYDWAFSKEPHEIKKISEFLKGDEKINLSGKKINIFLGKPKLKNIKSEEATRLLRPSIWITRNIKKGEKFKFKENHGGNIDTLRPNNGLSIRYLDLVTNCRAIKNLKSGKPLKIEDIN